MSIYVRPTRKLAVISCAVVLLCVVSTFAIAFTYAQEAGRKACCCQEAK